MTVSVRIRPAREERRRDVVHNVTRAPHAPVAAAQHLANARPAPNLTEEQLGVCTSCGADAAEWHGESVCCGSQVTYPGPETDQKESTTWL